MKKARASRFIYYESINTCKLQLKLLPVQKKCDMASKPKKNKQAHTSPTMQFFTQKKITFIHTEKKTKSGCDSNRRL